MDAYRLRELSFTYPGQSVPALDGVSLEIVQGEFFTLCGPSGCGKTTLLRLLKPALAPGGRREGAVLFQGAPLDRLAPREQAARIGFVLQAPEEQIVTDKVWHELAFGLESLGLPREAIRARVAEMAAFFGIEAWFHRDTASLSGGQKQLLNLAAVLALDPQVLLLDEPTSQLDPIAAQSFLDCLGRVNRELGVTVILSEHRLEEALPLSHRCAVLDAGRLIACGAPRRVGELLRARAHPMARAMPTPMRVWAAAGDAAPCPVTVGEGRQWLSAFAQTHPLAPPPQAPEPPGGPEALGLEEVWFRYERQGEDVLRGLSLSVPRGCLFALLGGNGAGKTTLLSLLAGARRPQRGRTVLLGRPLEAWGEGELFRNCLAVLPQDPKSLFAGRTVDEELAAMGAPQAQVDRVRALCALEALGGRHPYDLSGGEQQRAALAKVLLTRPRVLLLDEPTKGMDAPFKEQFAAMLSALCREGVSILMVSHDVEFCAQYAHRCALLFDGAVTAQGTPREFFGRNRFYTTAASRMARALLPGAVTAGELIAACGGGEAGPGPASIPGPSPAPPAQPCAQERPARRGRAARWAGLALAAFCLLAGFLAWRGTALLSGLAAGAWLPSLLWLGAAALALWLLGLGRRAAAPARPLPPRPGRRGRRRAALCLLVLCPLTLLAGVYLLGDRKYYFISLLLLLEALVPLALDFEGRGHTSRELVVLSVLTALAVAGRGAFFMLPQFKPVAAVTVLAGAAFGGQAGFLVGAASMLVSNFFYTQGAWTPWQMAAMGLIGLLAGVLARWVGRGRLTLSLYGFVSVLVLYGGVLNPASVLMYQPRPTWGMLAAAWAMGFPLDLVHAAATAFFLWAGGPLLLEKLDRVRVKYGLDGPG